MRRASGSADAARDGGAPPSDLALDAGAGEALTGTIGPAGGELRGQGVVLRIPEGALDRTITLRAEDTGLSPPPPYQGYSNVWRFTPDGISFARPVTISLRFRRRPDPAVAWSRVGAEGYDWQGGEVAGDFISAQVSHFSTGFVAARTTPDASLPDASPSDAATGDHPMVDESIVATDVPARPDATPDDVPSGLDVSPGVDATVDATTLDAPRDVSSPIVDASAVDAGTRADVGVAEDVIACRFDDVGPDGGDPDRFPGAEIVTDAPPMTVDFDRLPVGLNTGITCLTNTTESRDAVLHFRLNETRDVTFVIDPGTSGGYT